MEHHSRGMQNQIITRTTDASFFENFSLMYIMKCGHIYSLFLPSNFYHIPSTYLLPTALYVYMYLFMLMYMYMCVYGICAYYKCMYIIYVSIYKHTLNLIITAYMCMGLGPSPGIWETYK